MKQNEIDSLQLQRLVDGELDQEQTRQLLHEAQASPEHWKQIAVGFVESQSFERAFESGFPDEASFRLGSSVVSSESLGEQSHTLAVNDGMVVGKDTSSANARRNPNPKWVMAASLLAAAAIGYMTSQIQSRTIPSNNVVESVPKKPDLPGNEIAKNSKSKPTPKITPASLSPDYHLELPDENFQGFEDIGTNSRVPIYRVDNEKQFLELQASRNGIPAIPEDVLIHISQSGFQMEQKIEIISGEVQGGESFVVPIRTIRLVPYQ